MRILLPFDIHASDQIGSEGWVPREVKTPVCTGGRFTVWALSEAKPSNDFSPSQIIILSSIDQSKGGTPRDLCSVGFRKQQKGLWPVRRKRCFISDSKRIIFGCCNVSQINISPHLSLNNRVKAGIKTGSGRAWGLHGRKVLRTYTRGFYFPRPFVLRFLPHSAKCWERWRGGNISV